MVKNTDCRDVFVELKTNRKAGGDILGVLSFMKKAFSQNGRRNIAVVVDLLSLNKTACAPLLSDYI